MVRGNGSARQSEAGRRGQGEPRATVIELLRRRAGERPAGWAYSFLGDGETEQERLTYADLDRRARAIAVFLRAHASPGARILLLLPSGADFVASFFGCFYAGLIATPAYPPRSNRSLPRLLSIVEDSAPSAVLTTRTILARTREGLAGLPALRGLAWLAVDDVEETLGDEWRDPGLDGDAIAFLQYTSGSTSTPKGVVVTHRNLLHNQEAIRRAFGQDERSLIVGWLPLFHDMGLIGNVLQPLYVGAPCVLMPPVAFLQKPVRWLEAISRYRATTSGGPNFAYELCVEKVREEQREGLDLASWSVAFNGAEPVRASTLKSFADAFAPHGFRRRAFYPCYGLAEATLFVAGGEPGAEPRVLPVASGGLGRGVAEPAELDVPAGERRYDLVSCGRAPLGQEVRIVDPESRAERPEGHVGEVWVAGPSVTQGYWGRPEETAATFQARAADGGGPYLRTGDLGFVQDGDLFVTGRLKDLVILRGRNHYPQDLELTAEQAHASLRRGCGAAFAVEEDGEEHLVVVYEVDRHPAESAEAIARAVRREIAQSHEVAVREVVLVRPATIPKTSSGKIQRAACRSAYLDGGLQAVARSRAAGPGPLGAGPGDLPGRAGLEELLPPERRFALERGLRAVAASVLRLAVEAVETVEAVPLDRPLAELGLDSLSAIELRQRIEAGLEVEVELHELMDSPGLGALAAALAARLDEPGPDLSREPLDLEPLAPSEAAGGNPLSLGQRALWIEEHMAPESGAYNIAVAVRLLTAAEPEALRRAFEGLAARHEMLRTAFVEVDGEPRQRPVPGPVDFEVLEVEAGDLAGALRREAFRPFDLAAGRPLRVRVIPAGDGPVLLLAVHHLVADLRSLEILAGELAVLAGLAGEDGVVLPVPAARAAGFQDHVRRAERRLAGPRGRVLERYWSEALAGEVPLPPLPTDRPRTASAAGPGALCRRPVPEDLAEALAALASREGATLFTVLLAAFQALLSRYTGERDVWVGVPADIRDERRDRPDMAGVIGYFVNPVVMRARIGDVTFGEHLGAVWRTVVGALEHRDLPFPRLVERLQPDRLPGATPLFQTLFVFERASRPELAGLPALAMGEPGVRLDFGPPGGWVVESLPLADPPAQRELTLEAAELRSGLSAAFHYRSDLFDAATVERILGHFVNLLGAAAAHPEARLAELPLLSSGERDQIVAQWNAAPPVDREACLHDLVFAQAERTPEAVALVSDELDVTYRELCGRAADLAVRLRRMGVGPEVVVGICADRTPDMVEGVLGVLAAGGAYLPLDPAYPADRLAALVEDSGARLVLTQERPARRLEDLPVRRVFLDAPDVREQPADVPATVSPPGPGNLAYVIYTSGSTGRPKGVAIEHRNAVALVRWAHRFFTPEDMGGVLFSTSLSFDLSVFELFAPLACGGTVVMADNALALPSLAAAGRVRLLNSVPSAVAALAAGGDLGGVRTVCLAGEPLRRSLADRLFGHPGIERVFNLYGPTEDTTYSTASAVGRGGAGEPSIGRPIDGRRAHVLDPEGEPVPCGVPGELFLAGAGLARGYLGRPALTAERFVPDGFGADPGGRLYRTGDLARYRADGEIEFLGRIDHQVKVRGFRIEPGEIEARLLGHPDVAEAAVLARADAHGDLALVAYVAPAPGRVASEAALASHLRAALPEFMVPGLWVALERLPRTPNGKLDRRALPNPEGKAAPERPGTRARTPVEEILVSLWAELLGRQDAGVHDSFFDLGGHSLLAGRLLGRIRRTFEVDLPLSAVFAAPTPAGLAEAVEAARLDGARPVASPGPAMRRMREGSRGEALPVSSAQRRLWFLQQLAPGSGAYNMAAAVNLSGPLAAGALEAGLAGLVRRHEALRTAFVVQEHQPAQVILDEASYALPWIDLAGLPDRARGIEAERLSREAAARPFDPIDPDPAPLARFALVRLAGQEHRLLVVVHHLVADGGSIGVLLEDLAALYGAAVEGRPSPLPALPFQAADFAALEAAGQWPGAAELDRQLAYWRARLAGAEPLALPTDRPAGAEPVPRGGVRALDLPAELVSALAGLARQEGVTPFMLSLAGFAMLLCRYTGQDDFVIAVPVSQRRRDEAERVVGLFVNTLALRVDAAGSRGGIREMAGRVRRAVLEAFEHQDLPFDRLVEEMRPERQGSGDSPLVRVAFLTRDDPWPAPAAAGVAFDAAEIHNGGAKFDLTLAVAPGHASAEYRTDIFDGATLDRWLRHFAALLAAGVACPDEDVRELPMLSEAERHHLLREHNDTAALHPGPGLVHDRVARHAAERPASPAVTDGELTLTYGELERRAAQLALYLRSLGVGPEARVGVCLERSADLVVAFLAVLKVGGVYLPLDPGQPAERLALVAEDAGLRVMVTRSGLVDRIAPAVSIPVLVDRDAVAIAGAEERAAPPVPGPGNLAYVLYTSGSTGRPKGVEVPHAGLGNLAGWHVERYGLSPADRASQGAAPGFDASVWEMASCLAAGASLWIVPEEIRASPADLARWMTGAGITASFVPTPVAERILALPDAAPAAARLLLTGGDRLRARPSAAAPFVLVDHYGPTEASVVATSGRVEPGGQEAGALSIGRPIANLRAHLLGRASEPVPLGACGELCLGGIGLARGYLGRPGTTAAAFIPDPFAGPDEPGARLYRTGDLARRLPDGRLQFLGRADDQVKVRGVRIELGEVEAVLRDHPGVADAVAAVRGPESGERRLAAWFVPASEPPIAGAELAAWLRGRLPEAMIPSLLSPVSGIPLTPHGKVDRRALPALTEPGADHGGVAPRSPLEEVLAGMVAEVLGIERVGVFDRFFDLGGHSLAAAELVSRVRTAFAVDLPLRSFFEWPTVAGLAEALDRSPGERERAAAQGIPRRDGGGPAPLSFAQQRLWFLDQLEPGSAAYNLSAAIALAGRLDRSALAAALAALALRHEALRTVFEVRSGEPRQVVLQDLPGGAAAMPVVDLSGLPEPGAEGRRLALAEASQPFDLSCRPPLRTLLLALSPGFHRLVVTLHHIIADGWSKAILLREVGELYAARVEGRRPRLPELPIQYPDYAAWQREHLRGEALAEPLAYWREALRGVPPVRLPADRPRSTVGGGRRGGSRPAWIPPELLDRLRRLAGEADATLFMVLLAGWTALLVRHGAEPDIAVGTPVANRDRPETAGLIGFFVNTLVLRTDLAGDPGFGDLLRRVRQGTLAGLGCQEVPFEKLVEELQPDRSLGSQPLFQVMLALEPAAGPPPAWPGLAVGIEELPIGAAKFDLLLSWAESGGGLAGRCEYRAEPFDAVTVDRLLARLEMLLAAAVADPRRRLSELPVLLAAERHQLLAEWGGGPAPSAGACLHELIAAQAARTPGAVAVECRGESLTYRELAGQAASLARRLRRLGVGPEVPVAVCLDRTPALVAALLAVLEAGGAYVPIDPAYPRERQAFILEDAAAPVLITRSALLGSLPATGAEPLLVDRAPEHDGPDRPGPAVSPENLAYVIYTSGSTGRPKGVGIPHRAAVALVRWALASFPAEDLAGVLASTSVCFDLSIFELFVPLAAGGRVLLADNALSLPELAGAGVRLVNTVPSAAAELVRSGAIPASVRTVCLAGEPLPPELAADLYRSGVEQVYNLYGPTEDTTYSTWERVARGAEQMAIGRPLPGSWACVLDGGLRPVPPGAPGELCLGGAGLARGYLGRPDLTAERFVPDPLAGSVEGGRVYRTGDLARFLRDGRLEFLGRLDHQVKIRGFRIEPGEIEAALRAHPGVLEAAVTVQAGGPAGPRLVAYGVLDAESAPDWAELRGFLAGRLPDSMIPSAWVRLDALPLTPSGKVDRKALPAPAWTGASSRPPLTGPEEVLAGLWAELLGVPEAGVHDSFFERGGHSLLATRLVSRVREAFGVDLPLRAVFEAPTVAGLAARIEELRRAAAGAALPPLRRQERPARIPLSFAQERMWLLSQLDPGSPVYNLPLAVRLDGPLDPGALTEGLRGVIRRHEVLRTCFPVADGQPVQAISPAMDLVLPVIDLAVLPDLMREGEAARVRGEEARRGFDLAALPLMRASLQRLEEQRHVLSLNLHHAIADGWSLGVLARELSRGLQAETMEPPPSPLPIQYADFALWQREWLRGEALEARLRPLCERLEGAPGLLPLPTDRPRRAEGVRRGAWLPMALPGDLGASLEALARREGATSFMVLLAVFQGLLHRYSGEDDLVVGVPVANRTQAALEGLVGCFVNTLALRAELSAGMSCAGLLAQVRERALEAFACQDLPFERLVEELRPDRDLARTPLFQVLFVVQNAPRPESGAGLTLTELEADTGAARFDLTLTLTWDACWRGRLEFDRGLFDPATARRLASHFERLLAGAVESPGMPLADLPLLGRAERHQLVHEWNDTGDVSSGPLLHELVLAQAGRTPQAVALVHAESRLTYGELGRRVMRVARSLREMGMGPEMRVGVGAERSPDLVVGLLGVLAAGAAYVPLDPAYPEERLDFMLRDSGAALMLTSRSLAPRLASLGVRTALIDDLAARDPEERPAGPTASPGNLAYLIYTSGSTGRPKGVAIEHRAAVALVRWAHGAFSPAELAGVLAATSVCFDLSVFELFAPLACGGTVILAENVLELPRLPGRSRVTLVNTVPSAMAELLRGAGLPPGLTVNLAGEILPAVLVRQLRAGGAARVLNLYGPSEDTTYSTVAEMRGGEGEDGPPAIGRPIAGGRAWVLDAALRLSPIGIPGEVCLAGAGLARGYLGRPDLTAERFVPDPFADVSGGRLYRTGDLARLLPDGRLDFLGRRDHQVKVRGFRIELGEVEAALSEHPSLSAAVVVAEPDPGDPAGGLQRLAGWVVVREGGRPSAGEVLAWLARRLPAHAIPSWLTFLDELPRTPNGKVDRRALAHLERRRTADETAALSPAEEIVAGIFQEVLRIDRVGAGTSFFELGGHSLLASQAAARVRDAFGCEVPLRWLFEAPTVAALARRVTAAHGRPAAPPVQVRPGTEPAPLSFSQERLWFLACLEPGTALYNVPCHAEIKGTLDFPALAAALGEVLRRHEVLRTVYPARGGSPVQEILPVLSPAQLPLVDLAALPSAFRIAEARRLAAEVARFPFDLIRGPVLCAALVRRAEDDHLLLLTLHHIACDAWSRQILSRELAALYTAARSGAARPMPDPAVQYSDYAVWQRSWLQGALLENGLAYWRERLAAAPAVLELPYDRPVRGHRRWTGALRPLVLPPALVAALEARARRGGATLFMALLCGFQIALHRYSGQDDLVAGAPIGHRPRRELEDLIGFFVNTLALRADFTGDPTVEEHLARVRETTLDAYAHQDLPFERLVEALGTDRLSGLPPLVQAVLALQNAPDRPASLDGALLRPLDVHTGTAKFPLTLAFAFTGDGGDGGLAGAAEFASELFDGVTVDRFLDCFSRLLQGIAAGAGIRVSELPLLDDVQRHQLLAEWNSADAPFPEETGVYSLFAARAAARPEAIALVSGEVRLSYGELDRRARRLARILRSAGVGPEDGVGLAVGRSLQTVVTMLAVAAAGGVYVPLDPELPRARMELLAAEAGLRCAVAGDARAAEQLARLGLRTLDLSREDLAQGQTADHDAAAVGARLLYVMYTSGSTGVPKGVAVTHANVVRLVRDTGYCRFDPDEVFLQLAPIAFDASTFEVWGALLNGARLVIAPDGALAFSELEQVIRGNAVTTLWLTAGLFHQVVEQRPGALHPLRQLLAGGDVLSPEHVRRAVEAAPECRVINGYGPTEGTTFTACHTVRPGDRAGSVPIGRPIARTRCVVVDRFDTPVPPGVAGELLIGGEGLARGYFRRPDLTAERFVPDPFAGPGERLYRTGDRVRHLPGGELEFLGRLDQQVKLRGFRIEPGEVEAALLGHPGVREAVVVVREGRSGDRRLVAYVTAASEGIAVEPLRAYLRDRLPAYMVPSDLVALDELPLTVNGKVDRRALPPPDETGMETGLGFVPPRTMLEEALAGIWTDVLGIEKIGIHDNFFELRGHSLLATQVIFRVQETFGVEVPLSGLFAEPTIAALAAAVELARSGEAEEDGPALVPARRTGRGLDSMVDSIGRMSDAEVRRLLEQAQATRGLGRAGDE